MKSAVRLVVLFAVALLCGCGGGGKSTPAITDPCTGSTCDNPPPPPPPPDLPACPATRTAPWPGGRAATYQSPITAENAKPGSTFGLGNNLGPSGARVLEAYTTRASGKTGDIVDVKVSSPTAAPITWNLYRLGWYGGKGARNVASGVANAGPQPACGIVDASTGLVRCAWPTTFSFPLTPDLVSGYYLVQVQRTDGCGSGGTSACATQAPVVVVDDRPADILVQAGTNTWQAYNEYGNESLYRDDSLLVPGGLATQVSYDRPFSGPTGLPSRLIRYEMPFARWAERMGYDVSYTTTNDAALGGCPHIARAGMFVQVGHDEYTPTALRYALDGARDAGVSLAFLSGNPLYWKVRMEDFADARNPRTITVYKAHPESDPNKTDQTGRWRDPLVNHPENALVGVMYESFQVAYFPLVVEDPASWLFRNTGVQKGDAFPGLVGHEYDWRDPLFQASQPAGMQVHMRSPVVDALGAPGVAETVSYRPSSGALVFGAGTIQWVYGLGMDASPDDLLTYGPDPRIEIMTANIIQEAIGVPRPAGPFAPPEAPLTVDLAPATSVTKWASDVAAPAGLAVASVPGILGLPVGAVIVTAPRQNQISMVDPVTKAVTVLAGKGDPGQTDGTLTTSLFRNPTAVIQLPDGRLVVADTHNYSLRIVDVKANTVTHLAGGTKNASGLFQRKRGFLDGAADLALFKEVMGLAYDAANNRIVVADNGNQRIRAVSLPDGFVTTIAGNGSASNRDGPALSASIFYPTGVAISGGRIFVLSSTRLRAIDSAGNVSTIAGADLQGFKDATGAAAMFVAYGTLSASADGTTLYFADAANYRLRKVTIATGKVQTVAGQSRLADFNDAGGTGLGMPVSVAIAPAGTPQPNTIYISDAGFNALRAIRP